MNWSIFDYFKEMWINYWWYHTKWIYHIYVNIEHIATLVSLPDCWCNGLWFLEMLTECLKHQLNSFESCPEIQKFANMEYIVPLASFAMSPGPSCKYWLNVSYRAIFCFSTWTSKNISLLQINMIIGLSCLFSTKSKGRCVL